MSTEYVVRDTAGSVRSGAFPEGDPATIYVSFSRDVSLNLDSEDVATYTRNGDNLLVMLQDGQVLVLDGYFEESATGPKNLFLSEEGEIVEVFLGDAVEGTIAPNYAAMDVSGKWSAYDDLVFLDLGRVEPVVAPLAAAPAALGGMGWLAGGAAAAGAAAIGSSGGAADDAGPGTGTDTPDPTPPTTPPVTPTGPTGPTGVVNPTVDNPDSTQLIGGNQGGAPVVTGTGVPGSTVNVTVNDKTVSTTVGGDGKWTAQFQPGDLPADGVWDAVVTAENSNGETLTLDAPTMDIDTTPPPIGVTDGTQSTGDFVNAASHSGGATITGTSEAGASIEVTIGLITHSTTADANGAWSVNFSSTEISTGEYTSAVQITATDARGNSASTTETLVVDTEQSVTVSATLGGDGTINAAEAAAGATFTGTAQAGSSVAVTLGTVTHTVTADANGNWTTTFAQNEITGGTYGTSVSVTATDAYGNTATANAPVKVDTEIAVAVNAGQAGGDDVINQAEASADISLTGTAEAGSSVEVTLHGVTRTATVDANGNWTAVFQAGSIPPGEYDTTITARATDSAGNTAVSTAAIRVDTVAGDVALSTAPIEIDDVINAVERTDGVDISGTATPGLMVTVTLGTASTQVLADANGNWDTTFPRADIPTGTGTLPITATITDAVGNSKTVSDSVNYDTEVVNFTQSTTPVEGDDIINLVERADGVTLNGTVEAGSTVEVQLGNATVTATVDANGNWTADFPAGSIPQGTYDSAIKVTATDPAGNVATLNDTVKVDTEVSVTTAPNQTADDTINAAERAAGVTLAGSADAGSTIQVNLLGKTQTVTADINGDWSVTFPAGDVPQGTYTATAQIVATDPAGNRETVTESFAVDTQIETPSAVFSGFRGSDLERLYIDGTDDTYSISAIDAAGNVSTPNATSTKDLRNDETEFDFSPRIPDGTNLVISGTDTAGNEAGTMFVTGDNATYASTLGNPGASGFDITGLNLETNGSSDVVLTEAQIKALSSTSDTLTIRGEASDTVTIAGAVKTTKTETIDGESYDVYTLGNDGATIVIDDDINVII